MSSKLIHSEKPFFSKMVVDAIECLDQEDLDESLIAAAKSLEVDSPFASCHRLAVGSCWREVEEAALGGKIDS